MSIVEIGSTAQTGFPLLSALVALPMLGAVGMLALRDDRSAQRAAMAVVALTLLLSLMVLGGFQNGSADFQLVERLDWLPTMGVSYHLGVDGLSVLFLPLTAALFLAILAAAPAVSRDRRAYLACLLLLLSSTLGVYLSLDLILFFCFFELALVPSFWLIKTWGQGNDRRQAASRYTVYMLLGSLPILVGFVLLGVHHAEAGQGLSFDLVQLLRTERDLATQTLVFGLLAVGFAVKGPALPFHTWMPSAVVEGPVAMGAYLVGLKIGAYSFLRFVIPLAPAASAEYAPWVIGVELLAIVYAGLIALVQPNLRRLLVFASVSHVGLVIVAAFALNPTAWQGALLLMVNAGIATAGLFLCAGFLQRRLGSTDVHMMGGLARRMPRLAAVSFVVGLGLIGVPGTSGFGGELLAMTGAYQAAPWYGIVAATGVLLSAAYFLWFYQRAFFGPLRDTPMQGRAVDLDGRETTVAVALMASVFFVGLMPGSLTRMTEASTVAMTQRAAVAETSVVSGTAPVVTVGVPDPTPR